jgi:hypothetical protein
VAEPTGQASIVEVSVEAGFVLADQIVECVQVVVVDVVEDLPAQIGVEEAVRYACEIGVESLFSLLELGEEGVADLLARFAVIVRLTFGRPGSPGAVGSSNATSSSAAA